MKLHYRSGTPEDAGAIAELFERSFTETFGHLYARADLDDFLATMSVDRFRHELGDDRFHFLVAQDRRDLAGFLKLGPAELPVATPPDTIELCQLYVAQDWHGGGVAAALMDRALALAGEKGARHVQLSVYVDNHRALRFYERYGFEPVGRYDFMVGSHADEDIVLRHVVLQADR